LMILWQVSLLVFSSISQLFLFISTRLPIIAALIVSSAFVLSI